MQVHALARTHTSRSPGGQPNMPYSITATVTADVTVEPSELEGIQLVGESQLTSPDGEPYPHVVESMHFSYLYIYDHDHGTVNDWYFLRGGVAARRLKSDGEPWAKQTHITLHGFALPDGPVADLVAKYLPTKNVSIAIH